MLSSKIAPFTVFYENSQEYHLLKTEVFTRDTYYFETDSPQPRIIDAGAHYGLSTLYFKKLFPGAQVTAIEPNPKIFPLLEKNIWENGLTDVETYEVALAATAGTATLYLDKTDDHWWSTASFSQGAWNGDQRSGEIQVSTRPLADFLDQPVDFLKMDIEGAEQAVLLAAGPAITNVLHMIIEFHPVAHQSHETLLEFLQSQGFQTTLWKDGKELRPQFARGLFYIEAEQRKRR